MLAHPAARLLGAATLPPRALLRLCATGAALRRRGFPRVVAQARAEAGRGRRPTADDVARARRYAGWLHALGSGRPLRAQCLHRALALHFWLRDEGVASELRIGVQKQARALRAHAWVEVAGQVVDDRPGAVAAFHPLHGGVR